MNIHDRSPGELKQTDKRDFMLPLFGSLALLGCAVYLGFCFAVGGLTSSDTCWLLALGRKVWTTQAIPQSDPLSFTLPLAAAFGLPSQFMPRQWLFEVTLFGLYLLGNLYALIAAGAACTAFAFIVVPIELCTRANTSRLFSYALVVLAVLTAALRTVVRPEFITFAFLAAWLLMLQTLRQRLTGDDSCNSSARFGVDPKMVASMVALQIIWCNAHSGFVLALAILAIYTISFVVRDLSCQGKKLTGATKTALAALLASSLATVVNPVGFRLWQFLPTLFFSPMNKTIVEMRHIEFTDLSQTHFYPFFLLVAIALVTGIRSVRKLGHELLRSPVQFFSLLLMIAASIEALNCLRLMPVMAIVLIAETVYLAGQKAPEHAATPLSQSRLLPSLNLSRKLDQIWWHIMPPLTAGIAAIAFANRLTPLVMPQASDAWKPPMRAINFLMDAHNQPSGPIFNEAKIGALLTWYAPRIKVFFDTRFDQYGELLLTDYDNILYARANCLDLLQTYGIDWVFVPRSAGIADKLSREASWKPIYIDDEAIIFVRLK